MTLEQRAEAVAKRLDAWQGLVSSGYEVPAAAVAMIEAAAIIRELLADRAEYVDIERMKLGKV